MMDKNATMNAKPNEIVTKLVEMDAAMRRENGLTREALPIARKVARGGRGGQVGKSPKRDKRDDKRDNKEDNKDNRKEKDFPKCFHYQRRGHTTENCLSKQRAHASKSADTAAQASIETTLTITTPIEYYWMVASSNASRSDCFIDCGCNTHISGYRSMSITYTEYPPNMKKVKGYNGVTLFASGYGTVRSICHLPDRKTETIIVQEVVHLPLSFNRISQSQKIDKDIKVELLNHHRLNLDNRHGKLIATAPQVNGIFVRDHVVD
jgi:hypothetical protein